MGVRYDVKSATDSFEIYNVVTDPKQAHDLATDPAYAETQRRMHAVALQSRRPNSSAPRPYDEALVPALALGDRATQAGVEWRSYAGTFPWVPDFSALKPMASGTTPGPDPMRTSRDRANGFRFTGCLVVPADGEYMFYIKTDTGAVMRLHDATILDADFGYAGGTEKSARVRLQAGLHPFRLFTIHGKDTAPSLVLEWSGPGLERQPIPDNAFVHVQVIAGSP